jgi:hypothetical protein
LSSLSSSLFSFLISYSLPPSPPPSLTYVIRINGVPNAVLVTAEQKADPTFLLLKWVLLFAPQLRRWRLGLVITRLDEGYIGSCLRVCVCVCVCVFL